jgi:hypothetical protein
MMASNQKPSALSLLVGFVAGPHISETRRNIYELKNSLDLGCGVSDVESDNTFQS